MKIAECHLYEYSLPLKRPLMFGDKQHDVRNGYVIKLADESGAVGFGEVAPLDGYSDESFAEVRGQLLRLRHVLVGYEIPANLEELSGGFDTWLSKYDLSPSVRFGFESAVFLLLTKWRQVSLARLLSDNPRASVSVNALLNGSLDEIVSQVRSRLEEGYACFKLKVGRGPIDADIQLTREIRELIGRDAILRLDANRQWTMDEFEQFARGVRDVGVEYIEEPLADVSELRRLAESREATIPVSLDESLRGIDPDTLQQWRGVIAIVLKPTMLGLERSVRFARSATRMGMTPVFSSSYESSIGLSTIAQVAAAFNIADTPTGLDTVGIFREDLLASPFTIRNARTAIDDLPDIATSINRNILVEFADA